jgi:hypothetical protein
LKLRPNQWINGFFQLSSENYEVWRYRFWKWSIDERDQLKLVDRKIRFFFSTEPVIFGGNHTITHNLFTKKIWTNCLFFFQLFAGFIIIIFSQSLYSLVTYWANCGCRLIDSEIDLCTLTINYSVLWGLSFGTCELESHGLNQLIHQKIKGDEQLPSQTEQV